MNECIECGRKLPEYYKFEECGICRSVKRHKQEKLEGYVAEFGGYKQ